MKRLYILIVILLSLSIFYSCNEEDLYSLSRRDILTFSADTIKLDTVFTNLPTSTHRFWIYNKSNKNIRCTNICLEKGNQAGYRVNVDGIFLGEKNGFNTSNIEIKKNDSIRAYVELTPLRNNVDTIKKIEDNILFLLESGVKQKVNLSAFTQDAILHKNLVISKNTSFNTNKPIIIYGGIKILPNATLTIDGGSKLYFHNNAIIDVAGSIDIKGTAENNVCLRGDRTDRLFNNLPYDRVSGQWGGIIIRKTSYKNNIAYTDIHGAHDAIVIDTADANMQQLHISNSIIHNSKGYGIVSNNSNILLENCQITNCLNDCVLINGGKAIINSCTIAQFYPFEIIKGNALSLNAERFNINSLICKNTLITGYANDVLNITQSKKENMCKYNFNNCILRTPKIYTKDSVNFENIEYEDIKDTIKYGIKHFVKIDTDNLIYDFRLTDKSSAINKANPNTSTSKDRTGKKRSIKPDIGAYEHVKTEKKKMQK